MTATMPSPASTSACAGRSSLLIVGSGMPAGTGSCLVCPHRIPRADCFRAYSELMTELSVADGFVGVDHNRGGTSWLVGLPHLFTTVLRCCRKNHRWARDVYDAVSTGSFYGGKPPRKNCKIRKCPTLRDWASAVIKPNYSNKTYNEQICRGSSSRHAMHSTRFRKTTPLSSGGKLLDTARV